MVVRVKCGDKCVLNFGKKKFRIIFAPGEMAEWSIAAVLKTVEPRGSWGSNPYLSARDGDKRGRAEAKAFKFMNLKVFFFLCPAIQRPKKANTRQSLRPKSYPKEAGVKWGTNCLELSSCCRVLSVPYSTQNDIVNLIL